MTASLDLNRYRQIVVLTGAGVSAASGLPTYRGQGGIWTTNSVGDFATAAAMESSPARVWEFFARMWPVVSAVRPNPAHLALARAEAALTPDQHLTVLTQNVDGLHQAAGSKHVVELHGTLLRSRCTRCDFNRAEDLTAPATACPPCPKCSAPLRPDVVLFDEALSVDAEWASKKVLRDCDLFIAIGTSGTVSPASNFVRAAEYAGARTIYVNLEPMTPHNPAFREVHIGRAEELLPALLVPG
jgi:NAD-dependent deacetylase